MLASVPIPFLLGWPLVSGSNDAKLAQVSGRVTFADRTCDGAIYFLPEDRSGMMAMGPLKPDGSFQLYVNGLKGQRGALPGRYRAVVYSRVLDGTVSRVVRGFGDPSTTGLPVHGNPGWSYFRIDLR
jgi:hypothetical protein